MTFFEKIALADVERIHSQIISWIFSEDCTSISLDRKSKILCELFKLPEKSFSTIDSITELMRIDILILADSELFIIENKFKSTLSENQLEKYETALQNYKGEFFNIDNVKKHFGYLTLISEESGNPNWLSVDYYTFKNLLAKSELKKEDSESFLIIEYIKSLTRITDVCFRFIQNPKDFQNVFEDSSLKKDKKRELIKNGQYNADQKIVVQNNLETTLQRMYWNHLLRRIDRYGYVRETNGNAYVSIPFNQYNRKINKIEFNYKFEIQKNTVKINLVPVTMNDYNDSKKDWVSDIDRGKFRNAIKKTQYRKFNDGKTRAQISVTKKLDEEFYKKNLDDAANYLKQEIDYAELVTKEHLI